jgi:hypothetical protein
MISMRGMQMCLFITIGLCCGCSTTQTVMIKSIPSEAKLWVDGSDQGLTPQQLVLEKKTHRIELQKEAYEPFDGYIAPRPRNLLTHIFSLGFTLYYEMDVFDRSYTIPLKEVTQPGIP